MKFLSIIECKPESNYVLLEFEKHKPYEVCIGDQVWSDGNFVELSLYVEDDVLETLMDMVDNKRAFRDVLMLLGVL